jgi:hypothetical protein
VELEGQLGSRIGIRFLLTRQLDVESDRRSADIGCATVGRLHDAGTTARRNDVVALAVDRREGAAALGNDPAEATRFIVPARHPCGGRRPMPVGLADARAAQNHNGRPDAPGTKPLVGFGELEEKAHPLHGIAEEKVRVRCGQAIGGRKLLKLVVRH